MTDQPLKPCPFCGGHAVRLDGSDSDLAHCVSCDLTLDIEIWNTRPASPAEPDAEGAFKEHLAYAVKEVASWPDWKKQAIASVQPAPTAPADAAEVAREIALELYDKTHKDLTVYGMFRGPAIDAIEDAITPILAPHIGGGKPSGEVSIKTGIRLDHWFLDLVVGDQSWEITVLEPSQERVETYGKHLLAAITATPTPSPRQVAENLPGWSDLSESLQVKVIDSIQDVLGRGTEGAILDRCQKALDEPAAANHENMPICITILRETLYERNDKIASLRAELAEHPAAKLSTKLTTDHIAGKHKDFHIDNCLCCNFDRIAALRAKLDGLEGALGVPWPPADFTRKLIRAAEILMTHYSYDGHGHELISEAIKAARTALAERAGDESEGDHVL